MIVPISVAISVTAALLGAPAWAVLLVASALLANTYRQHSIAAAQFSAKHPGHVLTLDPWQPLSMSLALTSAGFAVGLIARAAVLSIT